MIKSIYSSYEASLNQTACAENFSATASRGALIFGVYSDPDESSYDSLDFITDALARFQLQSGQDYSLAELLNNL